ncbi:MAG: hypothetical protein IPG12_11515 [Saprospiraceae bacterium]|nr:hypothetical protein [Saprospiraceae bacterium]
MMPTFLTHLNCKDLVGIQNQSTKKSDSIPNILKVIPLDTANYRNKVAFLSSQDSSGKWPVKDPYPMQGAILPFQRIIAFYGNLYSKKMGILAALPPKQMLEKLDLLVKEWSQVDSSFPARPALHYIAVTAQTEGDKKRLRMPFKEIDKILDLAKQIDALVFLDIQAGWSTIQEELPKLEKYFKMPHVHLGIDPEFKMKPEVVPGSVIGTIDAKDINDAIHYLGKLVKNHNLPPKIIVIHRFTKEMLTNASQIKLSPEVQIIIHMDGFGPKEIKRNSYQRYIFEEPVQFTGFKIFYKNDTRLDKNGLFTPREILELIPKPIYIQYH